MFDKEEFTNELKNKIVVENKGQILAYIRVSTTEQNIEGQKALIDRSYEVDTYYTEKVSAKNTNRPQLEELLKFARKGDIIVISDLSRLARNTKDLLNIVEDLECRGIVLKSIKNNIDTSTAYGKLMLTMIGAINEFERENMLERQREGIAVAKQKGLYKGRKKIVVNDEFIKLYNKFMDREITKTDFAKKLNISRPTLDKMIKEYKMSAIV